MSKYIFFTERNIHGAWVVYGALGVKQYYDYTKAEAEKLYLDECKKLLFENERSIKNEQT